MIKNYGFDVSSKAMQGKFRRWLTMTGMLTVGLLIISGRWLDPWLWAYACGWGLFASYALSSIDNDLVRERFHPPNPGADRLPLRAIRLIALAQVIVGALDSGRWHLAPVPDALRVVGLIGMLAFSSLVVRAMRANRFFSAVVRIQDDRGHHVVTSGPYAYVRHPGYTGMILSVPCSGLALGSWLSVAISVAYSLLILRRVIFEDGFLQTNLQGYREYAERVRYRLIPHAW
jgi:protein-S-isoprenylcysteine O-methyltransferase Ste14